MSGNINNGGNVVTYLQSAAIRDSIQSIEGKILTRPRLQKTDGTEITWSCDVRITGYDDPLLNVPIAMANRELVYAEAGSAVELTRSLSGRFEITGFSKRMPGRRTRIGVDIDIGSTSTDPDTTLNARPLTYGELATFGGYGNVPYGAYGIFRGTELIDLRY